MSLELRDIHKHFGPVRANDGVSLTVERRAACTGCSARTAPASPR